MNDLIPLVSLLALASIMFNGGMEIRLLDIGKVGKDAAALALSMFTLIVLGLTIFFLITKVPFPMAMLYGVVFGSTSAPTFIFLISSMGCSNRIKTALIL